MYTVRILPSAKKDISIVAKWYNNQLPGLGMRFTQHIRTKISFIHQNPLTYSLRYNNIRTAVLDVFPYMIHYLIDDNKKQIIIIAILHTSRKPRYND